MSKAPATERIAPEGLGSDPILGYAALTGVADEKVAIAAFNRGLIDRYIRTPAILLALFYGATLGASGAAVQALFANPTPLIAAAVIYVAILWPLVRLTAYVDARSRRMRLAR